MAYEAPRRGLSLDQCSFYHRVDLPELRDRDGWRWDLIGDQGAYLGGYDFLGKRVFEFGTANGGLTFWMESQGAEVVACDLSPDVRTGLESARRSD